MADRRFATIAAFAGSVPTPVRKTAHSAGYDLSAADDVVIEAGRVGLVPTGLKAYMGDEEVLVIAIRSSLAVNRHLMLANGLGIIDSDYADNPDNEGHLLIALANLGAEAVLIRRGERIAQGIFMRYLTTVDDEAGGERVGGFGSTGR